MATTSIGTPNTPELSKEGFRLTDAMLEKYSITSIMTPCGVNWIFSFFLLFCFSSLMGSYYQYIMHISLEPSSDTGDNRIFAKMKLCLNTSYTMSQHAHCCRQRILHHVANIQEATSHFLVCIIYNCHGIHLRVYSDSSFLQYLGEVTE